MRSIGQFENSDQARRFGDYLMTRGIESRVDSLPDSGGAEIWVFDEDSIGTAKEELTEFRENPEATRFQEAAEAAAAIRRRKEKAVKAARKREVDVRQRWAAPPHRRVPITVAIMVLCVLPNLVTNFGRQAETRGFWNALKYAPPATNTTPEAERNRVLPALARGEVWRLITPIFLHGGIFHLLFNVYWIYVFGNMLENRRTRWHFIGLVLGIALVSNAAQYLMSGPNFVGISGVVYGLFGYCWVKSRLEPNSGIWLSPFLVNLMLLFLVLGMFGVMENVANTAHGVGLLTGMLIAFVPLIRKPASRKS